MKGISLISSLLLICTAQLASSVDPKCPRSDPMTYSVFYRHPTDCGKYYECSNGAAIQMNCPPGLYFNTELNVCDWPQNVKCVLGCEALSDAKSGVWSPSSCSSGINDFNASCKLHCPDGFIMKGSDSIKCTKEGWNSTNGATIPKCVDRICISVIIEEVLNKTLSNPATLLFILDESGSVSPDNFKISKDFIKEIVKKYPLSSNRSAGVITFSSNSVLHFPQTLDSTPDFMTKVDAIPYRGGGTNILGALEMAYSEMHAHPVHPLTLVFLITDGMSETDGTPAANKIKAENQPIFTIGIGDTHVVGLEDIASIGPNHQKNFYYVKDYQELYSILQEYIHPTITVTKEVLVKC